MKSNCVSSGPTHPVLQGVRILVVDDMLDNQTLIRAYLRSTGVQIEMANNGLEALEKAVQNHYELILMDVQMPVMDGLVATRKIREHGYLGPILAITAHAMSENRDICINAGCDDYLTKPITRARLIERLEFHLQKKSGSEGPDDDQDQDQVQFA